MRIAGKQACRNDIKSQGRDYARDMANQLIDSSRAFDLADPYTEGYRREFNKSGETLDNGRRV